MSKRSLLTASFLDKLSLLLMMSLMSIEGECPDAVLAPHYYWLKVTNEGHIRTIEQLDPTRRSPEWGNCQYQYHLSSLHHSNKKSWHSAVVNDAHSHQLGGPHFNKRYFSMRNWLLSSLVKIFKSYLRNRGRNYVIFYIKSFSRKEALTINCRKC